MPEEGRICVYLKSLPAPEKSGAAGHAKQKELSRRFLLETAGAYLRRLGRPERTDGWQVEEGGQGKPFFAGHQEICFSISHSGSFWCCAFSEAPVGLDLQTHSLLKKEGTLRDEERTRLRTERIAERFFHPCERAWLQKGGDFFAVWTAKEGYVKYTGEGMARDFGSFAVADEAGLLAAVRTDGPAAALRPLPAPPSCSLCLCAEKIGEVEIFRKIP